MSLYHEVLLGHWPDVLPFICRCYARLHPRAVNCRKKKCGHSNQVSVTALHSVVPVCRLAHVVSVLPFGKHWSSTKLMKYLLLFSFQLRAKKKIKNWGVASSQSHGQFKSSVVAMYAVLCCCLLCCSNVCCTVLLSGCWTVFVYPTFGSVVMFHLVDCRWQQYYMAIATVFWSVMQQFCLVGSRGHALATRSISN